MALRSFRIKDFQSIAEADITLGLRDGGGGITTIVGPSSTGKSAVLRSLRMLARNTNSAPVRVGAKVATVEADFDGTVVGIERGPKMSTYTLGGETYTKAGVSVPDEVAAAMALRSDAPDLHFSFQFDKPFLLGEPGSVVSEVIGRLTNANVLRAAVREGARRAQQAKVERDIRKKDALDLAAKIKERFATLGEREKALTGAQEAVARAQEAVQHRDTLEALIEAHVAAKAGLESANAVLGRYESVYRAVDAAAERMAFYESLTKALSDYGRAESMLQGQRTMAAGLAQQAQDADAEFHRVLEEAGACPLCGAVTGG